MFQARETERKECERMAISVFAAVEVDSITDLKPQWFAERGLRLLLLDFDNTIVPYTTVEPTEVFTAWLEEIRAAGVKVMVVSNSRKSRRVPDFCDSREIPWIIKAGKPSPRGLRRAMKQMDCTPKETAMAGDQTFTDVIAANAAGVTSVLVKPIDLSNPLHKIRYLMEQPMILAGRETRKT